MGASHLAGDHRKPCTTELVSTRTKGSLGVKITLEKTAPKPSHGVPQLLGLTLASQGSALSALPVQPLLLLHPQV